MSRVQSQPPPAPTNVTICSQKTYQCKSTPAPTDTKCHTILIRLKPPWPLRFYHGIAVPGGWGGWGDGVVANQVANGEGGETYDKVQNMVGGVDVCKAEEQAIVMTKGT